MMTQSNVINIVPYCTPSVTFDIKISGKYKLTKLEIFFICFIKEYKESNVEEYLDLSVNDILKPAYHVTRASSVVSEVLNSLEEKGILKCSSDIKRACIKDIEIDMSHIEHDCVYKTYTEDDTLTLYYDDLSIKKLNYEKSPYRDEYDLSDEEVNQIENEFSSMCDNCKKCPIVEIVKRNSIMMYSCIDEYKRQWDREHSDEDDYDDLHIDDCMFDLKISWSIEHYNCNIAYAVDNGYDIEQIETCKLKAIQKQVPEE